MRVNIAILLILLIFIIGCSSQPAVDTEKDQKIKVLQDRIDVLLEQQANLTIENELESQNLSAKIKELEQEKQDLLEQTMPSSEPGSLDEKAYWFLPQEKPHPANHITEDQIHVYEDRIEISASRLEWGRIEDTNSMDPLFDEGANTLEVRPQTTEDLSVGDIVTYHLGESHIIHRIIEIGEDSQGWYCIAKGDNLQYPDPEKVRFEQIERLLIGIIY
jgi:hypothetical protein